MTLVEFLHPIRNGKRRNLVVAVLFYTKHYTKKDSMTAAEIKTALTRARIPNAKKMNVNQIVTNSAPLVHAPRGKEDGALVFELTQSGDDFVRLDLGVPTVEPELQHEVTSLKAISTKVTDEAVRGFIDEAIFCLSVGALRAAVVLLWSGVMGPLHDQAWACGAATVNAAIQKQDPKARPLKKAGDFSYVKDRTFLDSSVDIGILDKGQKDTLIDALNLRNRCAHPTQYRPGSNKARSFIEDVVGIVFR